MVPCFFFDGAVREPPSADGVANFPDMMWKMWSGVGLVSPVQFRLYPFRKWPAGSFSLPSATFPYGQPGLHSK
jgi:hypothetical protein